MVDAGDLTWKRAQIEPNRVLQQQRKGELQHASVALTGIDAMVPGEADLALGLPWLTAQATRHALPFVAANLTCDGVAPFPASRTVSRGGVEIGFVGVIDPDLVSGTCAASDPKQAVRAAVDAWGGSRDLVVVLAHQPAPKDKDLAQAVPGIDLIVNGHGKRSNPVPTRLPGDVLQLGAGSRGKKLGVAEITLRAEARGFHLLSSKEQVEDRLSDARKRAERNRGRVEKAKTDRLRQRAEGRQPRLDQRVADLEAELALADAPPPQDKHGIKNRLRALGEEVEDHPGTLVLVEAAKVDIDALAHAPKASGANMEMTYIGSDVCGSCHAAEHAHWSTTGHASAWATLEKVGRSHDLDCWSCHVTGAGLPGGPTHPTQAAGLVDVGCEACHGPGATHVAAAGRAPMTRRPAQATCVQCHDGVKDEGRFDAEAYFVKIQH